MVYHSFKELLLYDPAFVRSLYTACAPNAGDGSITKFINAFSNYPKCFTNGKTTVDYHCTINVENNPLFDNLVPTHISRRLSKQG